MNLADKPIFVPSELQKNSSHLAHFITWLKNENNLEFDSYDSLWSWSVEQYEQFWALLILYFNVQYAGNYKNIISQQSMPGVKWFEGIQLNYAEHFVRHVKSNKKALIAVDESNNSTEITWDEVLTISASLQALYDEKKLVAGDRVVGYLPNIPEASISLVATIASGLVWSSCSPDFGTIAVIDRFHQIQPKVLIAVSSYQYGGKKFDRTEVLIEIVTTIKSIETVILIDGRIPLDKINRAINIISWKEVQEKYNTAVLEFRRVPFDHPMWVLYSSGTTGLPKAITHSQGGMLIEHLKYIHFHNDVKIGENYFWYTSTGWMMWNYMHTAWLAGATIIIYNGHPMFPSKAFLWDQAEKLQMHHFGTSAPYIHTCIKENIELPILPYLRSISSTGSPLSPEAYDWIYKKYDAIYLWSMSGGTDIATAFVGGCPLLPIFVGEIQCRALGCDLKILDENSNELPVGEVGELVINTPMPCMPIYFWNDPDGHRYREAYFENYPGKWRHGDWIQRTKHNGLIISGRSDTTLKRFGVRIGTAEIYNALAAVDEIEDSLIIHIDRTDNEPWMPLFVKLKSAIKLNEALITQIKNTVKTACSPRHVPDSFYQVDDIPYTLSGKKMETLVKKIFSNSPFSESTFDSMRNPQCVKEFIEINKQLKK